MSKMFILIWMLFNHIVDDYYLQGCLANMKQKKWWENNAPESLYRFDYIMALVIHSASWAFMIQLPLAVSCRFNIGISYVLYLAYNAALHAFVDDQKANRKTINLIEDQTIHIAQVITTFAFFTANRI